MSLEDMRGLVQVVKELKQQVENLEERLRIREAIPIPKGFPHHASMHTGFGHLPKDGSEAMTGDLDLAGNALLWTDFSLRKQTAGILELRDRGDTAYKSLTCLNISATLMRGSSNALIVGNQYATQNTHLVRIRSGNGAAHVIHLDAVGGVCTLTNMGDITMLATKSVDAYTNAGYIKLRRLSQGAEPTPAVGELLLWRDTDDDKTYLVYEDVDLGGRKIELT